MGSTLRPTITKEGQRYVDEPVYFEVSKARPIALAVNYALMSLRVEGSTAPRGPQIVPILTGLSHHERVLLRWMTPDGNGGLKPKYAGR